MAQVSLEHRMITAAGRLLQVWVSPVFGRRDQGHSCCCLHVNSNWRTAVLTQWKPSLLASGPGTLLFKVPILQSISMGLVTKKKPKANWASGQMRWTAGEAVLSTRHAY